MRVKKAQVGLLTWHFYKNVGSNLQAYAIQSAVKSLGYSCAFIDYRGENRDNLIKRVVRDFVSRLSVAMPQMIPEVYHAESYRFQKRNFVMSSPIIGNANLKKVVSDFDIFLCGSDQIWAPNVLNEVYLFSFLGKDNPRCSYAASIGLKSIPDDKSEIYRKYLSRFTYITVREQQGCDLLKEKYGLQVKCVLDPTFLVAPNQWLKIAKGPKFHFNYIFCYFLGNNTIHREWVRSLAKKTGLQVICLTDDRNEKDDKWEWHYRIGPEKFLWYLSNSEFIVTDSFHGVALSINLSKQFYAVERFSDEEQNNQNSRLYNILNLLGLSGQLLVSCPDKSPRIDYSRVSVRLNSEIERSKKELNKMIKLCIRKGHE